MNLKIRLYRKSTEITEQCIVVHGTFADQLQLFPWNQTSTSVPKDQVFRKFCGASAALLQYLVLEVNEETKCILD